MLDAYDSVMPGPAGIQAWPHVPRLWIPAYAGMTRRFRAFAPTSSIAFRAILALFCFLSLTSIGRSEDASPFLNLDAAACEKLDDINLQVGPPDAEIVAACAALHQGAVLGQRFSGGLGVLALALLGMVLVYAALGAPLRSVAGLMGYATGRSAAILSIETALTLLLRAGVGFLILAILTLPYATAAACVVMIALLILSLRSPRAAPAEIAGAPAPSRSSVVLADLINDIGASAAGILGLALLARRDPWWLGAGIFLAAVASVPAFISGRRRLRRDPTARLAAAAALGAIFGAAAVADPRVAEAVGDAPGPAFVSALVFFVVIIGAGWISRADPRSNPATG